VHCAQHRKLTEHLLKFQVEKKRLHEKVFNKFVGLFRMPKLFGRSAKEIILPDDTHKAIVWDESQGSCSRYAPSYLNVPYFSSTLLIVSNGVAVGMYC